MYQLLIVFLLFVQKAKTFDAGLDGLVKKTPAGNSGILRNCSSNQVKFIEQCYLEMFNSIGLNVTSLPGAAEDPFKNIRLDSGGMCRTLSSLRRCHSDVINECLNYNTFDAIFHDEINSTYYVSQTAFLQFFCDYGSEFVYYYDCLQVIDLDELSDTVYDECSVLEVGTCNSVKITTQCERSVFRNYCGHSSAMSYCQYFKVMEKMTGWGSCEYMPCINSKFRIDLVFAILAYAVFKLLF